jgi:hypothetical protein
LVDVKWNDQGHFKHSSILVPSLSIPEILFITLALQAIAEIIAFILGTGLGVWILVRCSSTCVSPPDGWIPCIHSLCLASYGHILIFPLALWAQTASFLVKWLPVTLVFSSTLQAVRGMHYFVLNVEVVWLSAIHSCSLGVYKPKLFVSHYSTSIWFDLSSSIDIINQDVDCFVENVFCFSLYIFISLLIIMVHVHRCEDIMCIIIVQHIGETWISDHVPLQCHGWLF